MARKPNRNPQAKKTNIVQVANQRGIQAIRRPVSPDSYDVLQSINDALEPEVQGAARLFEIRTIGVTIIGFSRYDKRHRGIGPRSRDIMNRVPAGRQPVEVGLGNLSLYGAGRRIKLSVALICPELDAEVAAYETAFKDCGFPLRKDPNCSGKYKGHCSMGLLDSDKAHYFDDKRQLERLSNLTGLINSDATILLDGPRSS